MSKRAVVTGGAGFIGSNLVDCLVEEGWEVHIIDDLYSGFMQNIEHHGDKITFHKGTIVDRDFVNSIIKEGDTIWHVAAINSVPRSIDFPREVADANIIGTVNILVAAKDKKARRVIYSGSSSAYGNAPEDLKVETIHPNPISPYGLSKFTGEEYCRIFSDIFGISTVTLRYFNVFGRRQNPISPYSAVVPKFIRAMLKDEPITIFGDGEQSKDFTFVDNVVEANYLVGTAEKIEPGVYNAACGGSISVNHIVKSLEEIEGYKFKIEHGPPRIGDVRQSKASVEKLEKAVGYKPLVTFEEGLKIAVDWYKNNKTHFPGYL